VSCDANVSVCEIQSADQAMQDHLRRRRRRRGSSSSSSSSSSGGGAYSEQTMLFDALQGLEAARRYIQQFDVEDDILVMHNKLENKLYTLKHQEKHKQITIFDWLKELFCFDFENDCYFMNFIITVNEKVSFTVLKVCKKIKHYYTVQTLL